MVASAVAGARMTPISQGVSAGGAARGRRTTRHRGPAHSGGAGARRAVPGAAVLAVPDGWCRPPRLYGQAPCRIRMMRRRLEVWHGGDGYGRARPGRGPWCCSAPGCMSPRSMSSWYSAEVRSSGVRTRRAWSCRCWPRPSWLSGSSRSAAGSGRSRPGSSGGAGGAVRHPHPVPGRGCRRIRRRRGAGADGSTARGGDRRSLRPGMAHHQGKPDAGRDLAAGWRTGGAAVGTGGRPPRRSGVLRGRTTRPPHRARARPAAAHTGGGAADRRPRRAGGSGAALRAATHRVGRAGQGEHRASSGRSVPPASGSSQPRTRSGGDWSATSTTGPSSTS